MSKKSIKGTKTEQNLVNAYVSESTAYSRYMFYASQAEKEKYFPISEVFKETADNELRHAKVFFKHLEGGQVDCNVSVDAGVIGDTASNLATAIHEEMVEGVEQYKKSAAVARKEGFDEIAEHFESIAAIEEHHRQRFETYLRKAQYGNAIIPSSGNASCADTYSKAKSLQRNVRHATILNATIKDST